MIENKKRKEQARKLKKKAVKLKARRKKVREQARNLKKKAVKLKAKIKKRKKQDRKLKKKAVKLKAEIKKVRKLQKKARKGGKDFGKFKGRKLKTRTEQEKRKIIEEKSAIAKKAVRTRKRREKERVLDFIHKHQPVSAKKIHTKLGFGDKAFGNYLDELLQSKKIHYREKYGWALSNFNFK